MEHFVKTNFPQVSNNFSSVFNCHNPQEITFLTRLCLGLSHFCEHEFKHSFQDSLNRLCKCGFDVESIWHFLLHCPIYKSDRYSLLSTIRNIECKILENADSSLILALLYGNKSLDSNTSSLILNVTIGFVMSSKRFKDALF